MFKTMSVEVGRAHRDNYKISYTKHEELPASVNVQATTHLLSGDASYTQPIKTSLLKAKPKNREEFIEAVEAGLDSLGFIIPATYRQNF